MNHTRKMAKKDTIFAFFRLKICVCQKKAVILQSRLKKSGVMDRGVEQW